MAQFVVRDSRIRAKELLSLNKAANDVSVVAIPQGLEIDRSGDHLPFEVTEWTQ